MMGIPLDMLMPLVMGAAMLGAVAILSRTALSAWREWIGLQRDRLAAVRQTDAAASARDDRDVDVQQTRGSAVTRIEMADLRERLRKLEAIAAGVDL